VPPSILRWAFHSPARLAAVSLVTAGIVVGVVVLAGSQTPPRTRAPAPQRVAEVVHPTPTATAGDAAPTSSERVSPSVRADISRSARRFVQAWARDAKPAPRSRWLPAMRAQTTGSLYRGLRATDPARLPRAHVRGVDLEEAGPFAGTAVVTLSGHLRVVVRLVAERGRWLAADIRPAGP
jgi:hypothetical protein